MSPKLIRDSATLLIAFSLCHIALIWDHNDCAGLHDTLLCITSLLDWVTFRDIDLTVIIQ